MILDLLCSFYDRSSPIYTQPRYLPPSKMLDADVTDSVIGEGCVIKVCCLGRINELNKYCCLFYGAERADRLECWVGACTLLLN